MEALTILILCGAGLILMIAYLMYRIGSYKKKVRIRDAAGEISFLEKNEKPPARNNHVIETPTIPEGEVLIILHKGNSRPWRKAVKDRLREGRRAVIITMRDPSQLRSSFKGDVRFIWLERSTAHNVDGNIIVVNPTNLSKLLQEVQASVENEGIVLFRGFEDLLSSNDASRVIRFLKMLDESCTKGRFSTIVPAPYKAIPQRIRVQLTESFETVVI
jgi:hypothetical protein